MPNDLPEGVSEADLVQGQKVAHFPRSAATFLAPASETAAPLVKPIPAPNATVLVEAQDRPQVTREVLKREYPDVIALAMDILSARLLGLIALITACIAWLFVVYSPDPWRITAAGAFSVSVFWPMAAIYWRRMRGNEGE